MLRHATTASVAQQAPVRETAPVRPAAAEQTLPARGESHSLTLAIRPARVALFLAGMAVLVLFASVAGQLLIVWTGHHSFYGFAPYFDVDGEANIPTYFAAMLLLFAAALFGAITLFQRRAGAPYTRRWALLALIFLYLSVDEASSLHEILINLRWILGVGGVFYFAWVIPGIVLVALFALSYWKFLLHLPRVTRLLVALAGVLYVAGALGMELIGGYYQDRVGEMTFAYKMLVTVEEGLELAGLVTLAYALLDYMRATIGQLCLRLTASD
ncbi:MAG TPA: hypothetical protein VER55_03485 [Ardenticatenaceae bacterium]|nr:hypothetical protein [Ardenticatenaceae bacterium]